MKNSDSLNYFRPVVTVLGFDYQVAFEEFRDYYSISVEFKENHTITIPGFDLEEMMEQLKRCIQTYIEEDE
ncbi:hypothetical protein [Jeotgalibacillus aurantiacus]|uniref:hypothetical protein n=1 Tax=Jeotgalibacillus aurantiacus TaxID=2763266 RepID=UPI001D09DA64|nr:hypothetical protein [Jeotgalibacillus aurantiacus]